MNIKIDFTLDDINAKEYARRFNVDVCDVREMIKEEAVDMLFTYYRNEDLISRQEKHPEWVSSWVGLQLLMRQTSYERK